MYSTIRKIADRGGWMKLYSEDVSNLSLSPDVPRRSNKEKEIKEA
jgi:hypothetical protein